MAKPVGSLAVRLTADTSEFQKRMRRATRNVKSMRRQMRSAVNAAAKYGAAITAAGAAVGAGLVVNSIKATAATRTLARVGDASVETFQAQAYAARLVGVENDKLADIYKDMKDRVGDFLTTGAGPMADFFEKIAPQVGVTAEQFRKLSGPQALQLFVDSLEKANLSQSEMTFHMEALAGDSTKLLPLLRDNGKGMKNLAKEARDLGLVLSDIEIEQIIAAEHSIDRVAATLDGVVRRVAVELAPLISAVADEFADAAVETGGFRGEIQGTVETTLRGFGQVADVVRGLHVVIKGGEVAFSGFNLLVAHVTNEMSKGIFETGKDWAETINDMIETANKGRALMFLDPVETIDTSHFDRPMEFYKKFAASAREQVDLVKEELANLLEEPMPSKGVEATIQSIREASDQAAKEIAENQRRLREQNNGDGDGEGGEGQGGDEDARKKTAERLERLRESLMSEREMEIAHMDERRKTLAEARANELLSEEEFNEMKSKLALSHWERMREIEQQKQDDIAKIRDAAHSTQLQGYFDFLSSMEDAEKVSGMQRVGIATNAMSKMTAAGARHNKEMFEMNKVAGIANALVSTYQGATKALEWGWPMGPIFAGMISAAGFAQVQAIRSQSFQGGGGGAAPSVNAGASAPPVDTGQSGGDGGRQQSVIVNLRGSENSTFSRQQVRDLIDQINEAGDDGAQVLVT